MSELITIIQAHLSDQKGIISLLERNRLYLGETSLYWAPTFLVAKLDDDTVIGCVKHKVSGSGVFELKSLAVNGAYSGHGIATRLTLKEIEKAKDMGFNPVYVRILKTNEASIALAEKLGFEAIPQEKYEVFDSCSDCLPDFEKRNSYCIGHLKKGEHCPIAAYQFTHSGERQSLSNDLTGVPVPLCAPIKIKRRK